MFLVWIFVFVYTCICICMKINVGMWVSLSACVIHSTMDMFICSVRYLLCRTGDHIMRP